MEYDDSEAKQCGLNNIHLGVEYNKNPSIHWFLFSLKNNGGNLVV